ncbi:MAG: alternative ribosome rescue aminoacyl-tRNA hydrolase ArfB [Wenzhouxiangellaceae bacterium]|nr:alternative ribosome rescue aminoacyl-tRNA hydrolase ArfB [Wenzhouxiangellaceae bacterium]
MIQVDRRTRRLLPPEAELEEKFIRAGGPGGQHVNTSATAVQLRFDAANSPSLEPAVRKRLLSAAGQLADDDGVITIRAESSRSQFRNRQLARQRLAELIDGARNPPKRRIATKPPKSADRRRLESKRRDQRKRRLRKPPKPEDW